MKKKQLKKFIRNEQILLWNDLDKAISHAYNGVWSMDCDAVLNRIIQSARLVGPTPYHHIQWTLLAGKVYETVLDEAHIYYPNISHAQWDKMDKMMGNPRLFQDQYALLNLYSKTCLSATTSIRTQIRRGEL